MTHETTLVYNEAVLWTFSLLTMLGAPTLGAAAAHRSRDRSGGPGVAVTHAAMAAAVATGTVVMMATAALVGDDPSLTVGDRTWLRFDGVAALVAPVACLVATTVLLYARRNLEGDLRAHRFAAGACALLLGTLVAVTAATFSVLVAGWLLASAATVALCGYRGTAAARATARVTGRTLAFGDLALAAAFGVTVAAVGDPDLAGLTGVAGTLAARTILDLGPLTLDAATLVAGLLVVAALARAGQLPLPRWLSATVSAPTPVSALLHAGAVNAGAVLLIRTSPISSEVWAAMALLAACTLANIAVAIIALRLRPDRKGQLAESTSAQMGFMLLAVAVGAPVVALTHLAGHALYKSARFLAAGDTVQRQVVRRRWLATTTTLDRTAPVAAGGVVAATWWAVSGQAGLAPAEQWMVGAALAAVAAQAAGSLRSGGTAGMPLLAMAGGALAASAGVALAADHFLGSTLSHTGAFVDVRVALSVLVVIAGSTALAWRSPTGVRWLTGLAAVRAADPVTGRASRVQRAGDGRTRAATAPSPSPSMPALEAAR